MEVDERSIAFAPFQLSDLVECQMTLHRADPATLRKDDGDRLLLDHRGPVDFAAWGDLVDPGPAVVAEPVLDSRKVLLEAGPLPLRALDQLDEFVPLLGKRFTLAADFHFLELAQAPQAHVEDRLRLP